MTPGESLTPWVLLIEEEPYLPSGPYLGRTTSGKLIVAQMRSTQIGLCEIT